MALQSVCQRIVHSQSFNRFIIVVILLAGALVGIETSDRMVAEHHDLLAALDKLVLGIFILEIVLKMIAFLPRPQDFFKDGWNVFDFLIVAFCLLPAGGGFGPVLRLFRLLRTLKLLTAVPKLQLLVTALLKSLPSMGYVTILLLLLFYIYGVAGVMFFGKNDPVHFGNLGSSLLSLFRVVTLEDWTDVMYIQIHGSDAYRGYNLSPQELASYPAAVPRAQPLLSVAFFVSFVLIGTMVMLNLVIGVIVNGMEDARIEAEVARIKAAQQELGATGGPSLRDQISVLSAQLADVNTAVKRLGKVVEKDADIDDRMQR